MVFDLPYSFKDKIDLKTFIKEKSEINKYKNLN